MVEPLPSIETERCRLGGVSDCRCHGVTPRIGGGGGPRSSREGDFLHIFLCGSGCGAVIGDGGVVRIIVSGSVRGMGAVALGFKGLRSIGNGNTAVPQHFFKHTKSERSSSDSSKEGEGPGKSKEGFRIETYRFL